MSIDSNPISTNGRESEVSIETRDQQFKEKLLTDVDALLPELKDAINIIVRGELHHYESPEEVLAGIVCGRVARVLGYLLRQKGYATESRIQTTLSGNNRTSDHAIVLVKSPYSGNEIIVDGAYKQFMKLFLRDDITELSDGDVLVLANEKDHLRVESELWELREKALADRPITGMSPFLLTCSESEFKEHFRQIWDLKRYRPSLHTLLEEDIEKYAHDKNSVSELTRELIEHLKAAKTRPGAFIAPTVA